jgi:hypothetical protein
MRSHIRELVGKCILARIVIKSVSKTLLAYRRSGDMYSALRDVSKQKLRQSLVPRLLRDWGNMLFSRLEIEHKARYKLEHGLARVVVVDVGLE